MHEPLILAERDGAILTLTLNRPEKRNALHPELVLSLSDALIEARDDDRVAVIIVTGAGGYFCAGLDIELLATWTSVDKMEYLDSAMALFRNLWDAPQPTIAAVSGPAIAGGFDLAAFCDIRLASPDAFFGQAEINLGLVQIIHPLYKSIGLGRAKELALTGANIDAAEAYRIGLVNHIYPEHELQARAREMAVLMASKPRYALFETKRLARELQARAREMAVLMASKPRYALFETKRLARELIDLDTSDALERVESAFCRCLNTREHHDRVAAFLDRHR